MTKLCVTVTGRTTAELRQRRDEVRGADLVELRVDTVEDPDVAGALADRRTPVIFTCRASWEGGYFRGSEQERHRLLAEAQRQGAEYVDVEWRAGFDDVIQTAGGKGVVISMHDFAGVPGDLTERAAAMRQTGAEVVKLAVMAHRLVDSTIAIQLSQSLSGPKVVLAMGDAGLATRALAKRLGAEWTYAGDGVAPGQWPPERLCRELGFDRVGADTRIFGVVGKPVMHSLSPAMHNAAFRAARIDAVYVPLAASDFADFIAFADALPLEGASVTAPFKLDAFSVATEADDISVRIGAANTLRRCGTQWAARNTDVAGFMAPLLSRVTVGEMRATVLGAGGAARAVIDGLSRAGAEVTLSARSADAAREIAAQTKVGVGEFPPRPGSWDLLVNTTPLGTTPDEDESPLPGGPFGGSLVYDLVYNPIETRFLREARAGGCDTIAGLEMLVAQAEQQFEWWTGQTAPAGIMHEAALTALSARRGAHLVTPGSPR